MQKDKKQSLRFGKVERGHIRTIKEYTGIRLASEAIRYALRESAQALALEAISKISKPDMPIDPQNLIKGD